MPMTVIAVLGTCQCSQCGVKHKSEQDLQDECATISLFQHFRGDLGRGFSTRDIANASLEILFFFFCFLVFMLFSLVCFFNPIVLHC